jgi:hypothetical protein
VIAGKTKNESLANFESTQDICRFGAGRTAELAHLPSARRVAAELNRRGIMSATGGQWSSKTVTRLRERLNRNSQTRETSHSK